jgi:ribose transport system substrate-binding protein
MKRLIRTVFCLVLALCLVSAAALTEEAKVFTATPEELAAKPEDMLGQQNEFQGMTIVFSQRNIAGSEWYEQLIRLAKAEAEHLGVNLIVYDAGKDIIQQMADIETAINLSPNAIIVNPENSSGVLPAIAKIHQANIPLTVVNSALDSEGAPFTFVSCDVENSGYQAGFELAKAFDERTAGRTASRRWFCPPPLRRRNLTCAGGARSPATTTTCWRNTASPT